VSNPFSDALDTDAIFIIGSNTTHNHPVAATFIKQAANAGTGWNRRSRHRCPMVNNFPCRRIAGTCGLAA